MLSGISGALLGANKLAKSAYAKLQAKFGHDQKIYSWEDPNFSLNDYDLVFLPGGHDKGIRQIIESARIHELLTAYFPSTHKPAKKSLAAICHGVQVLAAATKSDGKSIMHDVETTALPAFMEQSIFQATRLFMGEYYKTYGANSDSVQAIVTKKLDNPSQFKSSWNGSAP